MHGIRSKHVYVVVVGDKPEIEFPRKASHKVCVIRQRVNDARKIQLQRFDKTKLHSNAHMGVKEIVRYCAVKEDPRNGRRQRSINWA